MLRCVPVSVSTHWRMANADSDILQMSGAIRRIEISGRRVFSLRLSAKGGNHEDRLGSAGSKRTSIASSVTAKAYGEVKHVVVKSYDTS